MNVGLLMDRVEELHELPIIKLSGMDVDYYETDNVNGLYPMVQ